VSRLGKIEVTKQVIDEISKSVSKQLVSEQVKKQKHDRDWRLRNTKLLLKNYHILKEHCHKLHDEIETYEDSVFDPEDIEIKSIMASKAKTRRMVWYIDEMLLAYDRYACKAGEAAKRRYEVLVNYYIHPNRKNHDDLGCMLNISDRTVRRDLEDARKEFSIFLFGIFAIEDLDEQMSESWTDNVRI